LRPGWHFYLAGLDIKSVIQHITGLKTKLGTAIDVQ
jgi:hypothetical protein